MAGYVRQSAASIVPSAEITATPLNNEFNALQNAFSGSTGHGHTGGAGDGPKVSLTTSVSGVLPVANGGTGVTTIAALRSDLYSSVILGPNGTAAAPTFSFSGDTNTGIYSVGADQLAISAGGVQQALFTATTNTIVGDTTFSGAVSATLFSGIGTALTALNASNLSSGTVPSARISGSYTGFTTITASGAVTAASFSGSGASLTTLNASNLSSGTIPNARISGSYTGFTNVTGTGSVDFAKFLGNAGDSAAAPSYTWTGDTDTGMWTPAADAIGFSTGGVNALTLTTAAVTSNVRLATKASAEALRLDAPNVGDNPYITFFSGGTRNAYIMHADGTSSVSGIRIYNDTGATAADKTIFTVRNTGGANGLGYRVGSTDYDVYHTGNDSGLVKSTISITAGNGLSGGGTLAATRTITLGTPSSITNSTTNSVTATSHTHALGFLAAEVYTGTSNSATDYPVGTILMVNNDWSTTARNGTVTLRLDTASTATFEQAGTGTVLAGTWRKRGAIKGTDNGSIFQRTA